MNIIELIKDAAFFGGHIPNERLDECRYFFDNVIEKQCIIPVVVKSFTAEEVVSELKENETIDDAISFFNSQE